MFQKKIKSSLYGSCRVFCADSCSKQNNLKARRINFIVKSATRNRPVLCQPMTINLLRKVNISAQQKFLFLETSINVTYRNFLLTLFYVAIILPRGNTTSILSLLPDTAFERCNEDTIENRCSSIFAATQKADAKILLVHRVIPYINSN